MSQFSLVQALSEASSSRLRLGPSCILHAYVFVYLLRALHLLGLLARNLSQLICQEFPDHDHAMHAQVPGRHMLAHHATEGGMLSSVSV